MEFDLIGTSLGGNIQVVEADIEPLTSPGSRTSDSEEGRELGDTMGNHQAQAGEPLQNQDGGIDKQYGAATSAIRITSSNRQVPVSDRKTDSPAAVAKYNSDLEYDDDDEDTVLLVGDDDGIGDIAGHVDGLISEGKPNHDGHRRGGDVVAAGNNNNIAGCGGEVKIADGDGERLRCGWFGFAPPFVQIFNNARGYLFFACALALIQGMTAFGLVYVGITTLEHRFSFDSFRSSFIPSSYDFSALSISIFITYLGERGHKPRWIAVGSMVFSLGSVVFALPHFMSELYEAGEPRNQVCHEKFDLNGTSTQSAEALGACDDIDSNSDISTYYWVFIVAQVLHGVGGQPLYTLGITYMDENLHANDFGMYLGIFNAINAAGPALGYIIGGLYLKIYTDFDATNSVPVSPNNPTWVGAWWLGFLVNASLLFVTSFLMLGYPKALPGSRKIASERKSEVQQGKEFESGLGWRKRLRAFPRAALNLLTNVPFMCLNGFTVTEWFYVAGMSVFGPKYLESQLNLTSSEAAVYSGLLTMAGSVTGALVGGWVIKKFDLKFRGLVIFGMVCVAACIAAGCGFLLRCPDAPMAGVTVAYDNSSMFLKSGSNISAECNQDCGCGSTYDPVCGSNNVLYYSACYAGCSQHQTSSDDVYGDCSCIVSNVSSGDLGSAEPGKCEFSCGSTRPFLFVLFLLLSFAGMVIVPVWTATIRCVPHSQRTFALGLQTVIYSALGTVPGPVIMGLLIDESCLVWEEGCDGSRTCWLYRNSELAHFFFSVILVANVVSLLFLGGALLSYRVPDKKADGDGTYGKFENEDETNVI